MNRIEATKLFIKHNSRSKRTIAKLMKFKKGMSIAQYANAIGTSLTYAYVIARTHSIGFMNRDQHILSRAKERAKEKVIETWDESKTIKENADMLGVSYNRATGYKFRYNLQSRVYPMKEVTMKRLEKIAGYIDRDLSYADIARLMGLSRERIRQIVEEAKITKRGAI